jgi:tRNA (mo5U34)-methyltransferase
VAQAKQAAVAQLASPAMSLAERVAELSWYHTIDLPGSVVTPGQFDTRGAVAHVPLPPSLEGARCLDVGTWDGFWAFEMERRGAASVTAIDLDDAARWDWPPRVRLVAEPHGGEAYLAQFRRGAASFELAREALGSSVERIDCSVYDLDPEIHGRYDAVFLGSLLLHLRDPVGALAAIRRVCGGALYVSEAVELIPSLLRPRTPAARLDGFDQPWWWQPNVAAFHRMLEGAGYRITHRSRPYFIPLGTSHPRPPRRELLRSLRTAAGREGIVVRLAGIPHVAARAVPMGA